MTDTDDTAAVDTGRGIRRVSAWEAAELAAAGALLVDIRRARTRRDEGELPGALVVAGPVRDWRTGPDSPVRVAQLGGRRQVVVVGDGSQSSILAASALRGHGVAGATDLGGGFPAWRAAGLPVSDTFTLAGRVVAAALVLPVDHRVAVPA